jgi:hypothetical protein
MNKYNSRQKYGTGWFNESHRHSLARKGIKTGRKSNVSVDVPLGYSGRPYGNIIPSEKRCDYNKEDVTKELFEKYEKVRESGVTNMFDVKTVGQLSGLQREVIFDIMNNYDYLCKKYPGVRKDYAKETIGKESFVVKVLPVNEDKWVGNELVFSSKEEAEQYGSNMFRNWFGITKFKVEESVKKPNYKFTDGKLKPIDYSKLSKLRREDAKKEILSISEHRGPAKAIEMISSAYKIDLNEAEKILNEAKESKLSPAEQAESPKIRALYKMIDEKYHDELTDCLARGMTPRQALQEIIKEKKLKRVNFSIEAYKGRGVFDPFYDSPVDSDGDGIPDVYDLHPLNPEKGIEWNKKNKKVYLVNFHSGKDKKWRFLKGYSKKQVTFYIKKKFPHIVIDDVSIANLSRVPN